MLLTWEIASEAGLSGDHPLRTRLTEYSNGVFWLLAECCKATAEVSDFGIQLLIRHPLVVSQDQLGIVKKNSLIYTKN